MGNTHRLPLRIRRLFNRLSLAARPLEAAASTALPHELLFAARAKAGLSQAEAAARGGFTQQYWQQLESGKRDGSVGTWRRAFGAIECDLVLLPRPRRHLGEWRARRAMEGHWWAKSETRDLGPLRVRGRGRTL